MFGHNLQPTIHIFAMVDIEEYCRVSILKIKQNAIPSGNAQRKDSRQIVEFFYMQPRIVLVEDKPFVLNPVTFLSILWKFLERMIKIFRSDHRHTPCGGYRLRAFA